LQNSRNCFAAGLDVDKGDLKNAKGNGHDELWPSDLPITRGLEENPTYIEWERAFRLFDLLV
jgi:hypothetical protein